MHVADVTIEKYSARRIDAVGTRCQAVAYQRAFLLVTFDQRLPKSVESADSWVSFSPAPLAQRSIGYDGLSPLAHWLGVVVAQARLGRLLISRTSFRFRMCRRKIRPGRTCTTNVDTAHSANEGAGGWTSMSNKRPGGAGLKQSVSPRFRVFLGARNAA